MKTLFLIIILTLMACCPLTETQQACIKAGVFPETMFPDTTKGQPEQ